MSNIEAKVVYLSSFNFDSVLQELNVQPKQHATIRALRFIYDCMLSEERSLIKTRQDMVASAARKTIEKTHFVYDLIDTYTDQYLRKNRDRRDALISTALVGDLILKANASGQRRHFARNLLDDMKILHQEAEDICNGRPGDFLEHSIFLAHIRSMQFIQIVEKSIDEYDIEDLDNILDRNIPVIEDLCNLQTDIGFELNEMSMGLREILDEKINQLCNDETPEEDIEADVNYSNDYGADLVCMIPPAKIVRDDVVPQPITYLTDFNEVSVYDQLSLKDDELAAKASIRLLFSELASEMNIRTLSERQEAVKAIVRATHISYYMASEMAQEFMDGSPEEKEAMVVAAICESQSYLLGERKIIDSCVSDFAQAMAMEATPAINGQPEAITQRQSMGLSYIFAIKQIVDIISDLNEFESEEDLVTVYEDLKNIRDFMSTESLLGKKLQEGIDELHNNISAFKFQPYSPLEQAKIFLGRHKKPVERSISTLRAQALYANDMA